MIELTSLSLSTNKIKWLDKLENLTQLTFLDLSENRIQSLEKLKNLISLTRLELNSNQIIINMKSNPAKQELIDFINHLTQ